MSKWDAPNHTCMDFLCGQIWDSSSPDLHCFCPADENKCRQTGQVQTTTFSTESPRCPHICARVVTGICVFPLPFPRLYIVTIQYMISQIIQSGVFVFVCPVSSLMRQANDWLMTSWGDRGDISHRAPLQTEKLSLCLYLQLRSHLFFCQTVLSTGIKRRSHFLKKLNCGGRCQDEISWSFSFLGVYYHHSLWKGKFNPFLIV